MNRFFSRTRRGSLSKVLHLVAVFSLIASSFGALAVRVSAASVLSSDSFESGTFSLWSSFDSEWDIKDWGGHTGTNFASVDGASGTSTEPSLVMATSTLGATGLSLSFWHRDQGGFEADDKLFVEWSTDGSTWTNAVTFADGDEANSTWKKWEGNLPAGAENQAALQIRFRAAFDAHGDNFFLDDVTLSGTLSNATDPADTDTTDQSVCSFEHKAGRTIVVFDPADWRLRSDKPESSGAHVTGPKPVALAAGTYSVSLMAEDGYAGRVNVSQPHESWKLVFKSGTDTVATSSPTPDLADNVASATFSGVVDASLVLPTSSDSVLAWHAVYPDTSSPNSVNAVCAAIDLIQASTTPTTTPTTTPPTSSSTPRLELDKSGDYNDETGLLTWEIDWKLSGSGSVSALTINDAVQAGTSFVGATNGGVWSSTTGAIVWNLGAHSAPATGTVSFTVVLDPIAAPTWADDAESFNQGVRKDGGPIPAAQSDEDDATGPAQTLGNATDTAPIAPGTFVSLGHNATGDGGSIVLEFERPALNGPGNDLKIYEVTTATTTYPAEKARIETSLDGIVWTPTTPTTVTRDGSVDLGTAPSARYVRITDVSDKSLFPNDADGYDLDAVQSLYTVAGRCEIDNTATVTATSGATVLTDTAFADVTLDIGNNCGGTQGGGNGGGGGTTPPAPATSTLTVIKLVVNDNGAFATSSDFAMFVRGIFGSGTGSSFATSTATSTFAGSVTGTTVILYPGAYAVSETASSTYGATFSADCSGTIAAGEHKTCTITNNDVAPGGNGGGGGNNNPPATGGGGGGGTSNPPANGPIFTGTGGGDANFNPVPGQVLGTSTGPVFTGGIGGGEGFPELPATGRADDSTRINWLAAEIILILGFGAVAVRRFV
jgi:hypothetical protein